MTRADLRGQFVRFACIGAAAFVIDASVLLLARDVLGLGLYVGRLISFSVAVTVTWALNRRFTFPDAGVEPLRQWTRFVAANGVGAAVNYGTYAALVGFVPIVTRWPVLGVAAGSLTGLGFNFVTSRTWVFGAEAGRVPRKGDS